MDLSNLPRPSSPTPPGDITVVGGGVLGLWQALLLAEAGHTVRLFERAPATDPFAGSASRYAGAMLAPDTEAEAAPPLVRDAGRDGLALWQRHVPVTVAGSLVVAPPRMPRELDRFARATTGHVRLDPVGIAALEPELAGGFEAALYYSHEAHVSAEVALRALRAAAQAHGVEMIDGVDVGPEILHGARSSGWLVDCRGLPARVDIPDLRGVRGERVLVRAPEVGLQRPVRLLHPRTPLYVVPWPDDVVMIGATVIESEDHRAMTVRSAIELLSVACLLHPGFAEAEIVDMGAGVRPALPDNVPRVRVDPGRRLIRVNGAYRHGFLLGPVLAAAVRDHLAGPARSPLLTMAELGPIGR